MMMERLTAQKSTQVAELPDEYRVVGLDHGAPLIRKPNGQVLRIQQNGRPVGGVTEARCRPAARHRDERDRLAARWGATPYTQPCRWAWRTAWDARERPARCQAFAALSSGLHANATVDSSPMGPGVWIVLKTTDARSR
jgi:hypothetical protein